MFDIKMNDKYKQCIAKFLKIDVTDLNKKDGDHWGLDMYNGWAVGTDEEATKAAGEYIEETLWAFNSSFLAEQTELPESVFEALQPQCENSNDAVRALIDKTCGLEDFTQAAIGADGRGHFLASYDGEEGYKYYTDEQGDEQTLYFYRID